MQRNRILSRRALALIALATVVPAQLTLTPAGAALGLTLTTYATGFPNPGPGSHGPIGIAFRSDGGVLVTLPLAAATYLLPNHADGQVVTAAHMVATYAPTQVPGALAQIPSGASFQYFTTHVNVFGISATGAVLGNVAPVPDAIGLAPFPLPPLAPVGPLTGHLFVGSQSDGPGTPGTGAGNKIWDVNPAAGTAVVFANLGPAQPDGLCFSPDGALLYVSLYDVHRICAFDAATGALAWQSPVIPAGPMSPSGEQGHPDGIAIGLGSLSGYLFVNATSGEVWMLGLPGGPAPGSVALVVSGGSRGDFVAADPDVPCGGSPGLPSLLLTQTDRIVRLCGAGAGFFAPPGPSVSPIAIAPPCAAGNAGGPPSDVLRVDGSPGGPSRSAVMPAFTPFTLSVLAPAADPAGAPYALWVTALGPSLTTLPFSVGTMCFAPLPLAPAAPTLTLADLLGFGFPAVFPASPAPASFPVPGGLPFPISILIQGVILDLSKPFPYSVTNAMTLVTV